MKVVIDSAGGVASHAQLGSHELLFDQPSAVPGGEDRGPSPLDVLAARASDQELSTLLLKALARLPGESRTGLRIDAQLLLGLFRR